MSDKIQEARDAFEKAVVTELEAHTADVDRLVGAYIDQLLAQLSLKLLGVSVDNWGDMTVRPESLLASRLYDRAVAEADRLVESVATETPPPPIDIPKKVATRVKQVYRDMVAEALENRAQDVANGVVTQALAGISDESVATIIHDVKTRR